MSDTPMTREPEEDGVTVEENGITWQHDLESLTRSSRSRLLLAHSLGVCGFCPYPNQGGYDHWYCEKRRYHLGPHRFVNYVAGRLFRRQVHYKPTLRGPSFAREAMRRADARESSADSRKA